MNALEYLENRAPGLVEVINDTYKDRSPYVFLIIDQFAEIKVDEAMQVVNDQLDGLNQELIDLQKAVEA